MELKPSLVDKDNSEAVSSGYRVPAKMVAVPANLDDWRKSLAFADVVMFILEVNKAVRCKPRSVPRPASKVCRNNQSLLSKALCPKIFAPIFLRRSG